MCDEFWEGERGGRLIEKVSKWQRGKFIDSLTLTKLQKWLKLPLPPHFSLSELPHLLSLHIAVLSDVDEDL